MNAFAFCFGFHQAAFLTVQRPAIVPVRTHRICSTELPNFFFFFSSVNHVLFCTQTLHRTGKNFMKRPQQPTAEPSSACEKVAVIWPRLGSAFASPCLVLAEESPPENCWLLSFWKLSQCHILTSTKRKRTVRNRSAGCSAACKAATEKKEREDSPRYILT